MTRPILPVALCCSLLLAAGCQNSARPSLRLLQPGEAFVVSQIDGAPAPAGVTLVLGAAGSMTGQAPCGRYRAVLRSDGRMIAVAGFATTAAPCPDAARRAAAARFATAMQTAIAAGSLPGGQVALTDAEGRARLTLQPLPVGGV